LCSDFKNRDLLRLYSYKAEKCLKVCLVYKATKVLNVPTFRSKIFTVKIEVSFVNREEVSFLKQKFKTNSDPLNSMKDKLHRLFTLE